MCLNFWFRGKGAGSPFLLYLQVHTRSCEGTDGQSRVWGFGCEVMWHEMMFWRRSKPSFVAGQNAPLLTSCEMVRFTVKSCYLNASISHIACRRPPLQHHFHTIWFPQPFFVLASKRVVAPVWLTICFGAAWRPRCWGGRQTWGNSQITQMKGKYDGRFQILICCPWFMKLDAHVMYIQIENNI